MTSKEDAQRSIQDVITDAIAAEDKGVPVNWKEMCLQVYNVSMNHIANLTPSEPEES